MSVLVTYLLENDRPANDHASIGKLILTKTEVGVIQRCGRVAVVSVHALVTLVADRVMLTNVADTVPKCRVIRTAVSMAVTLALCTSVSAVARQLIITNAGINPNSTTRICCGFAVQQSTTGLWTSVIFVRIDLYNTTSTVDCKSAAKKHFSQYHAWTDRYDKGLCLSVLGVARSPLTARIS